ncbi:type II secretion system F family protein [bacterium]|nr:type II secretion system F family protein [bacterium]
MDKEIEKNKKENILGFSFFALNDDKKYFLENLAMLIGASVPINKSLLVIEKGAKSLTMKKAIKKMIERLESGHNLSEIIDESKLFGAYAVSLIRIGEKTGRLNDNLKIIIDQRRKDESLKAKITSAVMYPFIILFISVIIAGSISLFLLPKLVKTFSDLKIELPSITQTLISFSYFMESYGLVFIPFVFLLIVITGYFLFFNKETKSIGQYLSFNVFGGRKIIQENELARFGYNMGILLKSGLSISECFDSLVDSTDFYCYKYFYKKLKNLIEEGQTFEQIFSKIDANYLIPRSIQQMIIVAEKSGRLSDSMLNIGQIYQERIDNTTKNISTILEPVLLIIIWVGVLLLSIAIILPIYSLIGNFSAQL